MKRIFSIAIRITLALGLAITILYYVQLARGVVGGVGMFFPGALGGLLNLHDILSLLVMFYWLLIVINFRRMSRPLVPFAVFFLHTVVEPYLLLGGAGGATFIRTARFLPYYLSYPLALSALSLRLIIWYFQNRGANATHFQE